jgi:hypothetical protein
MGQGQRPLFVPTRYPLHIKYTRNLKPET